MYYVVSCLLQVFGILANLTGLDLLSSHPWSKLFKDFKLVSTRPPARLPCQQSRIVVTEYCDGNAKCVVVCMQVRLLSELLVPGVCQNDMLLELVMLIGNAAAEPQVQHT